MADFALFAADGITPASLDFGQLFSGLMTSWRTVIAKNISGSTITDCVAEASIYDVRFQDANGNETAGSDGLILTQDGQDVGTILNDGTVEILVAVEPASASTGEYSFQLDIIGTKGASETTTSFNGSFTAIPIPAQSLAWRISVIQPNYPLLHYDEDGVLDPDGAYIEDPDYPGTFILDPLDGSGNYPDITDVLASAGVEFV